MTDWKLKLRAKIEATKNDPEKIEALVKEYILEFAEEITSNKNFSLIERVEDGLLFREIDNYNTDRGKIRIV